MGIFNHNTRSKVKTVSNVGITPISLKTPGILAGTGYHLLTDAPEVDAGIRIIADLVASMPIHLMENRNNGDIRIKDALSRKIDIEPWSLGTRQSFVHWIMATMIPTGNAVVIPTTSGAYLSDLVPAPGASIHRDYGSPTYYARYEGETFDAGDILHFKLRPDPMQPWRGRGLEIQMGPVVDSILQSMQTRIAYMSSEYKPPLIISVNSDSPLSEETERSKFLAKYLKRSDPSEPWILPADLMTIHQAKPLSLTDLAIRDGVELDKKTVATILGIPPFLVGVGAYNKEEFNTFISTTIRAYGEIIQQELTKKLLTSPNRYFRMNRRSLMAYSLTEIGSEARENRAAGLISGNEARNEMGYAPREGLDELVMLENYIPAARLGDQKKLNGATAPKEDTADAQ